MMRKAFIAFFITTSLKIIGASNPLGDFNDTYYLHQQAIEGMTPNSQWKKAGGKLYVYQSKRLGEIYCHKKSLEHQESIDGEYTIFGMHHIFLPKVPVKIAYVHDNQFSVDDIDYIRVSATGKARKKISLKERELSFRSPKWRHQWKKGEIKVTLGFRRPVKDEYKKRKVIWEIHLKSGEVYYKILDLTLMHQHSHYVIFREADTHYDAGGINIVSDLIVNRSNKELMQTDKTFEQVRYDEYDFARNYGAGALKPMDDGIPRFRHNVEYDMGENNFQTLKVTEHILPNKGGYWVQSEIFKIIPYDVYKFDYCGLPKFHETKQKHVILNSYRFMQVEENKTGDDDAIRARLNEYKRINQSVVNELNKPKL